MSEEDEEGGDSIRKSKYQILNNSIGKWFENHQNTEYIEVPWATGNMWVIGKSVSLYNNLSSCRRIVYYKL